VAAADPQPQHVRQRCRPHLVSHLVPVIHQVLGPDASIYIHVFCIRILFQKEQTKNTLYCTIASDLFLQIPRRNASLSEELHQHTLRCRARDGHV
jgi:hypothetical protein